jgi:hypothetical protein
MPASTKLKYHRATLDCVGRKPALSRAAVKLIDAAEKKTGLQLPPSVREWYSLTGCDTIIGNPPVWHELATLRDLLKNLESARDLIEHFAGRAVTPALQIGQIDGSSYRFWLDLDGSADPPVSEVDRDAFIAAEHFSEFLFGLVWEPDPNLSGDALVASKHPFGPPPLDFMKEHYNEGLPHRSRYEGNFPFPRRGKSIRYTFRNYPFYNSDGKVTIRCAGDPTTQVVPALWSFHAASVTALVKLVTPVWRFGGLNKALRATSELGESALVKLDDGG